MNDDQVRPEQLRCVGLADAAVDKFCAARPAVPAIESAGPDGYGSLVQEYLQLGEQLWRQLPPRLQRRPVEEAAAQAIKGELMAVRQCFLRYHGEAVYRALTAGYADSIRVRDLLDLAADRFPGLVPSLAERQAEWRRPLKAKERVEHAQALLLSQILGRERAGAHLVEAMLRPRAESESLLAEFRRAGRLDLGTAVVERQGQIGLLTLRNQRYLNAEDDGTVDALEIGTDLILLDPAIEVGILRGGPVLHPKYQGRRVFNSGINLTHLYHGQISYTYFLVREMGFVHKLYRGLLTGTQWSHEPEATLEKPWIGAVDTFAIGGGCQLLPVFDHVIAEAGSFFNLPARKEGIIPGAANLRLPRLVGDRLARQAVLFDRDFPAESPEGRLLCDLVVPAAQMDEAITRVANGLLSSGLTGVVTNRRALRVMQEPVEAFQTYMAIYAREQADCYYSPALVRNLEAYWGAQNRRP